MPPWLEVTLAVLYTLLGPLTWGFMVLSMYEGRRRMSVLLKAPPLPDPAPPVTVMIPARNEESNIENCVTRVLGQDYPNLRVVVADDRSTDATPEILARLAAADPRLHVVRLTDADFMKGWGGKSSALHNAYEKGVKAIADCQLPTADSAPIDNPQSAIGNSPAYLLGLDSDARLTRTDAISASVRSALKHKTAIFSLLPALENQSFFEELVIPPTGMLSSAVNAVALTNVDSFKKIAYANGQCLLIRRDVYDEIGGHAQIGPITAEDVALATLVKGRGGRVRVAWGAEHLSVRMYDSLGSLYRGLSRVISVSRFGKTWPMWAGISFLLLCAFSIYPAAFMAWWRFEHPMFRIAGWGWLVGVVAHAGFMVWQLGLTYAWSKNRWWMALLFPLSLSISLAIYVRALRQCVTGKFEWRGMTYSVKAPAAGQVVKL